MGSDSAEALPDASHTADDPKPDTRPDRQVGYDDDRPPPAEASGAAAAMAGQFLRRAYFLRLHEYAGEPDKHPRRASVCFAADFVLRALAALLVLAIALGVAWKALAPLT